MNKGPEKTPGRRGFLPPLLVTANMPRLFNALSCVGGTEALTTHSSLVLPTFGPLPMLPPELNRGHTGMNFEGSRKMLNDAKATFDGNRLARQFGVAEQVFGTRNSRLIQKFVHWNPGVLLK